MTAGQKRFDDWLAGRAEQAGGRAAFLRADGRADESHWESIRRNVFSLFRDVLSAAQKANGGEEQAARRFFAEKLGVIPASWETALQRAERQEDTDRARDRAREAGRCRGDPRGARRAVGGKAMTETQALQLFKCLADKSRLQILKSLAREDLYVERLSERLGLSASTVSFHLRKLTEAGAVTAHKSQYYTIYALNRSLFETKLLDVLEERPEDWELQRRRDEAYRQKVLDAFFEDGRLRAIPAQLKKKRIVLAEIARAFEPGRSYPEREVNLILAAFHDDFCTLRRDLVGEGFLTRAGGLYQKEEQH